MSESDQASDSLYFSDLVSTSSDVSDLSPENAEMRAIAREFIMEEFSEVRHQKAVNNNYNYSYDSPDEKKSHLPGVDTLFKQPSIEVFINEISQPNEYTELLPAGPVRKKLKVKENNSTTDGKNRVEVDKTTNEDSPGAKTHHAACLTKKEGSKTHFDRLLDQKEYAKIQALVESKIVKRKNPTTSKMSYHCSDCPKKYTTVTKAKEHIDREHMNVAYKCPIGECSYFGTWNNLSTHIKTVHRKRISVNRRMGQFPEIKIESD